MYGVYEAVRIGAVFPPYLVQLSSLPRTSFRPHFRSCSGPAPVITSGGYIFNMGGILYMLYTVYRDHGENRTVNTAKDSVNFADKKTLHRRNKK